MHCKITDCVNLEVGCNVFLYVNESVIRPWMYFTAVKAMRHSVDSQDSPLPDHDDKSKGQMQACTGSFGELRNR